MSIMLVAYRRAHCQKIIHYEVKYYFHWLIFIDWLNSLGTYQTLCTTYPTYPVIFGTALQIWSCDKKLDYRELIWICLGFVFIDLDRRGPRSTYDATQKFPTFARYWGSITHPVFFTLKKERKIWELIKKGALNLWQKLPIFVSTPRFIHESSTIDVSGHNYLISCRFFCTQ